MNTQGVAPRLLLPTDWSAEQALAIHDFLADLTEAIWLQYEDPMIELLQGEADKEENEQPDLFGFDNPIPF